MPEFHGMRHVHCVNFFRHSGCIYCKWKQFMTSEQWSDPVCVLSPQGVKDLAAFTPEPIPLVFGAEQRKRIVNWLDTLSHSLADVHNTYATRHADVQWLRDFVEGRLCQYVQGPSIEDFVRRLVASNRAGAVPPASAASAVPSDAIVQMFPGADVPQMPANALLQVSVFTRDRYILHFNALSHHVWCGPAHS